MANTPNPRNLDPKFRDAKADEQNAETDRLVEADTAQLNDNVQTDVKKDDDTPMIVHNERYMDGSVQKTREHRVPVSEWAAYEKEHGF